MNADLTRLIRLQQLESAADDARRRIADHPARTQALDARLQSTRDVVDGVKARLTAAAEKRRVEEKEVATVQARLAKYKDQLLEVKTNREYTAMLHEIETAQNDIRGREDRILEVMMESDELNALDQEERSGAQDRRKGNRRGTRRSGCRTTHAAGRNRQNRGRARHARRADRPSGAEHLRNDGKRTKRGRRCRSAQRALHHLPRAAAAAGIQ